MQGFPPIAARARLRFPPIRAPTGVCVTILSSSCRGNQRARWHPSAARASLPSAAGNALSAVGDSSRARSAVKRSRIRSASRCYSERALGSTDAGCRPLKILKNRTSMGGETLTDDVFEYLAGFMAPADLLATAQVNSYWRSISARDSIWRRLCVLRWLLRRPERLKRTTGTESFMELYRYLDRNRYLPQEKYSAKQVIWGKSRQESADAWVTVVHTPDCRTPSHRGKPFIQLRVVLQNLHAQAMNIELHDMQVRFKNGDSAKILGVGAADYNLQAQTLAPSLVAINGVDVLPAASHRPVELRMFDIATLSVNVECEGCEFETDFLESCSTVWVPIRRMGKCKSLAQCRCGLIPDSYHRGSIRVPIVDEAVVWKHYTLISGRFMVFDSRNSQDLLLFDPPFKSHSPSRSRRKRSIS